MPQGPALIDETIEPGSDNALIEAFAEMLQENMGAGEDILLMVGDDERALPQPLLRALLLVATAMAAGRAVTIAPLETRLTSQQAADMLGMSRPTLVRLLDDGAMTFDRSVGGHRRVPLGDVLRYRKQLREQRMRAITDTLSESLNDDPFANDPEAALVELRRARDEDLRR